MKNSQFLIAHRGINTLAPENTMAAFELAYKHGCTWIEIDVDVISDGTVIVCHDTTLDRTTNYSGSYYQLQKEDLSDIDAGSWFGMNYVGEPIPTLRQVIEFANRTEMNINIELKSNETGKEMSLLLVEQVIAEVSNLSAKCQLIISSFNHLLLAKLKEKAAHLTVGCIFPGFALMPDWRSRLELVGADFIHPEDKGITAAQVHAFRDAGFGVNVWTVNNAARANQLFNWGVNGIFTDIAHQIRLPGSARLSEG